MKSIRIADEVYSLAQQEAAVMSRSIAQQLEHWAKLGAALESAGVTHDQMRRILGGDLRVRERVFMKLGLATQESMALIPPAAARSARVTMPPDSALDAR
jgi:hypothetical protein